MADSPAGRLTTIATCSLLLAAVSLAGLVAQILRARTSVRDVDAFSTWQQPFVDGASSDAAYVGIAAVVLLLMLPVSRALRRVRRATTILLGAAAGLNFLLGVGYVFVSGTFDEAPGTVWGRPSVQTIVINQLPSWSLAVVMLVVLLNGLAWGPFDRGERTAPGEPPVGEYLAD